MPEPSPDKEVTSVFNRDRDDPFSSCEDKAKALEKLRFLGMPVLIILASGRPWTTFWVGFSDIAQRYFIPYGCAHFLGTAPPVGSIGLFQAYKNLRVCFGVCPSAFAWRMVIASMLNSNSWQICSQHRHSFQSMGTSYSSMNELDQNTEDGLRYFPSSLMIPAFGGFVPRSYVDTSPYGVYCCATLPEARQLRNFQLTLFFTFQDYYMSRSLAVASISEGVMGSVIAPIGVFAWKRFCYFIDISTTLHDTCFKGHAFVLGMLNALISFNMGLSMAVVGVRAWLEAVNYVCIDWAIYIFRIGIVARLGMKQCPKLVTFVIKKQMENIPAPLPNHVQATGNKTAMRVTQAFLCLSEGEGMTMMFFLLTMVYLISWVMWRDPQVLYLFPMRSFLVIALYMVLDLIQDFLADHLTTKFNNWSWLYKSNDDSWYGKQMRGINFLFAYCLACESAFRYGVKFRWNMHFLVRAQVWESWHHSCNALVHL